MNAPVTIDNQTGAIVPMDLLQRAVANSAPIETLEKLMGLQERWEANEARKAFDAAVAAAKAEIPVIEKKNVVDFRNRAGQRTRYAYESFADIAAVVAPILAKHGLSYRYRSDQSKPGVIAITCILAHALGHFEETTLMVSQDTSAQMNASQAIGSAVTYLQRYTLKAALGLAAAEDDDAQASASVQQDRQAPPRPPKTVEWHEPVRCDHPDVDAGYDSWRDWAEDLVAYVRASKTLAEFDRWLSLNNDPLLVVQERQPQMYAMLKNALEIQRKRHEKDVAS